MMRATTVKHVKEVARSRGITLEELKAQCQMVAFMGDWEHDDNEVLVPNGFPVGVRVPVAYVI
jgi:hypothetical protein